jgi:PIN domain nuclease of toxin-antitoxin system
VRVLLDTDILLGWLSAGEALPPRAGQIVADPDTVVMVSAASACKIAIKKAAGRLDAPDDLLAALDANAVDTLAITAATRWPPVDFPSIVAIRLAECSSLRPEWRV